MWCAFYCFCLATLPGSPDWWSAAEILVTGALSVWPLVPRSPPCLTHFNFNHSYWKSPGGSKFLLFTDWWRPLCTETLGDSSLYTSADLHLDTILSQRSTENPLNFMAWFVLSHALLTMRLYTLGSIANTANQLNLPKVASEQAVETSDRWSVHTGCTWAQMWVLWKRLLILLCMLHVSCFGF